MSEIQRYYAAGVDRTENGPFVKYDDHVAAVAAAENLAYERGVKAGYTAREEAVAVVDRLRAALADIDAIKGVGHE